jgi:hypothetical protein
LAFFGGVGNGVVANYCSTLAINLGQNGNFVDFQIGFFWKLEIQKIPISLEKSTTWKSTEFGKILVHDFGALSASGSVGNPHTFFTFSGFSISPVTTEKFSWRHPSSRRVSRIFREKNRTLDEMQFQIPYYFRHVALSKRPVKRREKFTKNLWSLKKIHREIFLQRKRFEFVL